MESRSRASPEQFSIILEFMTCHGDIARPQQGTQGRIKADRLWQKLTLLLNSTGAGVTKSVDKWKKVWADWKAKTKKKALAMRREAQARGTGGASGPNTRQILRASEQRVLSIMGLTAVIGQVGNPEGFDELPLQRPSQTHHPVDTESDSQSTTNAIPMLDSKEDVPQLLSTTPSISETTPASTAISPIATTSLTAATPPIATNSSKATTSPDATALRGLRRRRQHRATPYPVVSQTASTLRRERLFRARTRRVQTPFEKVTTAFVSLENRRLQLEELRERNNHQRDMEKLRLESRRIDMEESRNQILNRALDCFVQYFQLGSPASNATE